MYSFKAGTSLNKVELAVWDGSKSQILEKFAIQNRPKLQACSKQQPNQKQTVPKPAY